MGEIDLKGISKVALDTAPIIYYAEENQKYVGLVEPVIDAIDSGAIEGYTSIVTLVEVLVKPLRDSDEELTREYRSILLHSKLNTVNLDTLVAEKAASVRAIYGLRVPDSIQIAVGILNQVDLIITNEPKWRRIKEVTVIVLDDLVDVC